MANPYLTKAAAGFLVGLAAGVLLSSCAPSTAGGGGGGYSYEPVGIPRNRQSTIIHGDGRMETCMDHGGGIVHCM